MITAMIIRYLHKYLHHIFFLSAIQMHDSSYIHLQVWIVLSDIILLGQEKAEFGELISKIELIPKLIPLKLCFVSSVLCNLGRTSK